MRLGFERQNMNATKSKLGITPGEWKLDEANIVSERGTTVVDKGSIVWNFGEGQFNARLIAEAGTVANETGLWPRELAEQRKELLYACELAYAELSKMGCECDCENLPTRCPVCACKAAIASAEGKGEA